MTSYCSTARKSMEQSPSRTSANTADILGQTPEQNMAEPRQSEIPNEDVSKSGEPPLSPTAQPAEPMATPYKDPEIPLRRFNIIIASMCVGLFLSFLDTSIVATALYAIGEDFSSLSTVNWVALSYTLAYVGTAVIFASSADVFGRRNAFVAASIIFIAFSIGCGFARSLNMLIALRTMQGIGGAGLYALTMVIFPEITPMRMLKWVGGIVGAVVAVAGVLGPVLGGLITNYTTWRWIFWINGPIGILSAIPFYLAWPPASQLQQHHRHSLKQLDIVGSLILLFASVLVVFAFQQGSLPHTSSSGSYDSANWKYPIFIVPIVVGSLLWIVLLFYQRLVEVKFPDTISSIFPLRLLRNRVYASTMLATVLTGYVYFTIIFTLPTLFQVAYGKTVLTAGLALLPVLGGSATGSMLGGAFSSKRNNTFFVLLAGAGLMLVGIGLLSTLGVDLESKVYGFGVFVGLGFGLSVSTVSIIGNIECEFRDSATSQGIIAQMRVLGGSIGIAASTAILSSQQRIHLYLPGILTPSQLNALHHGSSSTHRDGNTVSLTLAQYQAIRQTYATAFSQTMKVCAGIAGLCVLVTLGTYQQKRELITEVRRRQVAAEQKRVRLEKEKELQKDKSAGHGGDGEKQEGKDGMQDESQDLERGVDTSVDDDLVAERKSLQ